MPALPRPDPRRALGAAAERVAAQYLQHRGYRVLDRNVRLGAGEIDLVAQDGDCVVLVEVRLRRSEPVGAALESVARRKQARLRRLAAEYSIRLHPPAPAIRVDVVAIALDSRGHLADIVHVKNAVEDE